MADPVIAEKRAAVVELEPGTYWWCQCGRSQEQPFCDGSHRGTSFEPLEIEISEPCRVALCQCKHTQNSPFCDGSHKQLP